MYLHYTAFSSDNDLRFWPKIVCNGYGPAGINRYLSVVVVNDTGNGRGRCRISKTLFLIKKH